MFNCRIIITLHVTFCEEGIQSSYKFLLNRTLLHGSCPPSNKTATPISTSYIIRTSGPIHVGHGNRTSVFLRLLDRRNIAGYKSWATFAFMQNFTYTSKELKESTGLHPVSGRSPQDCAPFSTAGEEQQICTMLALHHFF